MSSIDLGQALTSVSQALAVIVSALGLIVTVSQVTRPAILKRREKWLREALASDHNDSRRALLSPLLDETTARIVGGMLVPGWRFLLLIVMMAFGPIQAAIWARNDPSVGGVVAALSLSLFLVANPIRQGTRLLAERFRVTFEYREGDGPIRPPRVGILNLSEGGTRREFTFALIAGLGVNLIGIGVAFIVLGQVGIGTAAIVVGSAIALVLAFMIRRYALARVTIYGPWSVDDPKM